MAEFVLPEWLYTHAIAEHELATAYEAAGAHTRAAYKTTIARLHALWGEHRNSKDTFTHFAQGFSARSYVSPAPYTLLFCPAEYTPPAAFLAALTPALLAGVASIIPCFTGTGVSPLLLAALELAGVEHAFTLDHHHTHTLLAACAAQGAGRVLLFDTSPEYDTLYLACAHQAIPCQYFTPMACEQLATPNPQHFWCWPHLSPLWFHNTTLTQE